MKKLPKILTLLCASTKLASCGPNIEPGQIRSKPEKIAEHLYETTYIDWNEDKANALASILRKQSEYEKFIEDYESFLEALEKYSVNLSVSALEYLEKLVKYDYLDDFYGSLFRMACTSIRSENYIGRNFDWTYDDIDEYIVRVPADEEKHRNASVGVAHCFFPTAVQQLIGMEDIIPMLTMDGINDKGVAINVNVVIGDSECCGDTYGTFENAPEGEFCTGDLCTGFVVRYVLDHANSAAHAVYLLEHANIYSVTGQEFHYMISDKDESYVCEFVNNNLVVLKGKGKNAAMSNFHVTHSPYITDYDIVYPAGTVLEKSEYEGFDIDIESEKLVSNKYYRYPMGVERYARVKEKVSEVDSRDDMLKNMAKVYYKKMYLPGNEEAYWSDCNYHPYEDKFGLTHQFEYYDDESLKPIRMAEFKAMQEKYAKLIDFESKTGCRTPSNVLFTGICQTVHSSAYDIKAKKLSVNVQEIEKTYTFSL
ncbi:MAG: hypothetical protein KBS97_02970 [Firmicutes bacterium]|nr:hypothetical protein [Candidatus Fiminaster equi]